MKQHIFPALKITALCILIFMCGYTFLILSIARVAPDKGRGETVTFNNKIVGYRLEGQSFTADNYFNGRPSAVGYNAAGSGGSNKGPSNPEYLKQVQDRIDSFLLHNPTVAKENIPADLLTASGSGLDPDISPEGAYVQVTRIAKARNISTTKINELVKSNIEYPLYRLFGPEKVNVLRLNIALDKGDF